MNKSQELFERAKKVMPGGVNSPVRAFLSVGGTPRYIKSAKDNKIKDVDGNEYLDYISSWGPMLLGHANEVVEEDVRKAIVNGLSFGASTELEVEIAELITSNIPHIEMVRMVNSGTEAVMSALRLARGYTKREKVIKFSGCYHGHCDSMLVKAGSGALTFSDPDSPGVTQGTAKDTLIATYNDIASVEELFAQNKDEIAAIIIEPVAANMGVVAPKDGFLQKLRQLCDENSTLLIFDEVITGFRLCFGGAAQYYGVTPDLVTYGKIIGGGMPVGAYGGRKEIMQCVSPSGKVYQAGTLSGNPIAMTAGLATLRQLCNSDEIYTNINTLGGYMADELRKITGNTVNAVGSLVCLFFTNQPVTNFDEAFTSDTQKYSLYFKEMLDSGIYIAPAQFEAMFIGNKHTKADIDFTVNTIKTILNKIG